MKMIHFLDSETLTKNSAVQTNKTKTDSYRVKNIFQICLFSSSIKAQIVYKTTNMHNNSKVQVGPKYDLILIQIKFC